MWKTVQGSKVQGSRLGGREDMQKGYGDFYGKISPRISTFPTLNLEPS
jgi:hypothetical protein